MLPTFLGGQEMAAHQTYKRKVLDELAASSCLWEQRMSIVCSWKTSS